MSSSITSHWRWVAVSTIRDSFHHFYYGRNDFWLFSCCYNHVFFSAVKKEAWVTVHPIVPHLYLEHVTGIIVDLCTMLTSHSIPLWADCGDELTAASNIIFPSDSSFIWFTSQQAQRWGINVSSALIPLLFFFSKVKGIVFFFICSCLFIYS